MYRRASGELLLAMIGLHGIVSYAASRRTFEIGVRLALGATRSAVVMVMLRGAVLLVGVGCAVGVVLSVFVVQTLRPLLAKGQSPIDPIAAVGVLTILLIVAAAASVWPAGTARSPHRPVCCPALGVRARMAALTSLR